MMLRNLGRSLGERLGSVALRYQRGRCGQSPSARALRSRRLARFQSAGVSAVGAGATSRDRSLARLEAVLFLASAPLATRKLAQLAGLADGTQARTLVRRLNDLYDQQSFAFRAEEVAGGVQLMTRPRLGPWLRRHRPSEAEVRLSAPAQETLSVVAYRQPVLRAELEAIRGVQCGEMLRQLMERDLVRIVGRSKELGRPFLYGTTTQFLQAFGLKNLDDLPDADKLRPRQQPDTLTNAPPDQTEEPDPTEEPSDRQQESDVKTAVPTMHAAEESTALMDEPQPQSGPQDETAPAQDDVVALDEDEDNEDLEEDEDDLEEYDDLDDDEEEDIEDEDDLEEDEWEEVDDDFDDEDEEWEDDDDEDDWDDDDEEDDDWDDDGEEEEEEEEEKEDY